MKKRVAIVSSYNEECGAAYYSSRLLKHLLAAGYEVEVKRLPVSLLRLQSPTFLRRKGDQEIARIAREIAEFDAVFLQFEPGLYGTRAKTSYTRVLRLLKAAKCAVIHMSRCAAAELSPQKIRVNAICPGLIATSIFGASMGLPREVADQMAAQVADIGHKVQPIPKSGAPDDIARAALYLASDDSVFVTGTHLVVDGGITIGGRGSWDPNAVSPILEALGITAEQAQQMRAAMQAQQAG